MVLKTALDPGMIPGTSRLSSLRNSPSAGGKRLIYVESVRNCVLSKLEPVRFSAPGTNTLKQKQ